MPRSLFALVTLLVAAPMAAGQQSDLDLRNENQRLRTEVGDLERELAAARDRIADLQTQVAQMRELLTRSLTSAPAATQPASPEPVSIDESVPNASPRALLGAMQASYHDAVKDLELGRAGSRERNAYMRAVESWARRAQRDLKSQIVWTVRVLPAAGHTSDALSLRVQAVDPQTDTKLGEPFIARITAPVRRKLGTLEKRDEIDVLVLKGVLRPVVHLNEDRMDVGPFDNPRFIGPFAEFAFVVEASSLTPPHEEQPRQGANGRS